MKKLLALLLLSPIANSYEDKWWEQDLGIYSNLYDVLLAESLEEREARFFAQAEYVKKLACNSEMVFSQYDKDIDKCYLAVENTQISYLEDMFYLEKEKGKELCLNINGGVFCHIEPNIAALLLIASFGAIYQYCIPENQGEINKSDTWLDKDCRKKMDVSTYKNIFNANWYSRVKYLERRGVLDSNYLQKNVEVTELVDDDLQELSKVTFYLEKEFRKVYCASAIGIIIEDDKECYKDANEFLKETLKSSHEDIKRLDIKYVDKFLTEALAIQYITIAAEKCWSYTLVLDDRFNRKYPSKEESDIRIEKANSCIAEVQKDFDNALKEAELILKREALWKSKLEKERKERIAEAKYEREREKRIKEINRQREIEKENAGSFFGRLLTAVIVEAADVYIKDKVAKELNIKTGVYHSQDYNYCYYTSPTGMKKIKKKSGKSKTINYGNIGTNKPVVTYKKMPKGWSEKNTIYSFSDSSVMKVRKTAIYDCPQRIE